VFELGESHAAIIACLDEPTMLDRIPDQAGIFRARVAPDELLLVGPAAAADALMALAANCLEPASWGMVVDVSDGWVVWTVSGCNREQAWARVSANPLPDARPVLVQGTIASIPAKAIVCQSCLHLITPSPLGHHLPSRLEAAGQDLGPRTRPPAEFALEMLTVPTGGSTSVAPAGAGR
jgi:hypothetical protein